MNKYFFVLLVFVFSVTQVNAQKKKSFLDRVSEGIDKVNSVLDVSTGSSPSGGNSSGKGLVKLGGKTIQGSWSTYDAGGFLGITQSSPRNHTYIFNIDRDYEYIDIESSGEIKAQIKSYNGKQLWTKGRGRTEGIKAGKYYLYVQGERYDNPRYEIVINATISGLELLKPDVYESDIVSFGEEGGGGNLNSPRNHVFMFEPERDYWIDIDVESDGVPIDIDVISPSGKRMESCNHCTGSLGRGYSIDRVREKGKHFIIVKTREVNARGNFKITALGKFIKKPERIPIQEKLITNKWTKQSAKHIYTFSANEGNQEVILRSTAGECNLIITDQYGSYVEGDSRLREPGLKSIVFNSKTTGNYKIEVQTTNPNGGDYELLVFGQFSKIEGQAIKYVVPQNSNLGYSNGTSTIKNESTSFRQTITTDNSTIANSTQELSLTPTENSDELIIVKGSILNKKTKQVPSNIRLIYEDLLTGEILGEILPNYTTGEYEVSLPKGKRYGLTATVDGYIASSENIDLTTKTVTNKNIYRTKTIYVTPIEVGSSINLNNIFFETGKPILLSESFTELNRLANLLSENSTMEVEIAGHTDNVGADTYNITLSKDRASSVINYLISKGIASQRLQPKGYGKSRPVAPNTTEEGKAQNRRVEFVILKK